MRNARGLSRPRLWSCNKSQARFCEWSAVMTALELLHDYAELVRAAPAAGRQSLIQYLDSVLPEFWQQDYARMTPYPGDLVVISSGDDTRVGPFCRFLFDHSSSQTGRPGSPDIRDRQGRSSGCRVGYVAFGTCSHP